jgi:hypothetical protein
MPGGRGLCTLAHRRRRPPRQEEKRMSDDFGTGEVIISILWFMFLIGWIYLTISILSDLFRDRELSGGAKAGWALFIIILPWIGAVVYLTKRGGSMHQRAYERQVATGKRGVAGDIRQLHEMHANGDIAAADYQLAKSQALSLH